MRCDLPRSSCLVGERIAPRDEQRRKSLAFVLSLAAFGCSTLSCTGAGRETSVEQLIGPESPSAPSTAQVSLEAVGGTCTANGASPNCSSPTSLAQANAGGLSSATNNLFGGQTDAWYAVQLGTGTAIHPYVSFTNTVSNEFVFDVRMDCSGGTLTCGSESRPSNGNATFEIQWTGQDPNAPTDNPASYVPCPGVGQTLLIHVYRAQGIPVTCNNYTLQVKG
jgi:hypothetical protein